jgi:hypothetical protein
MIAITYLLVLVSYILSISKAAMTPELIVPTLKVHDSADKTLISDPYINPVSDQNHYVENLKDSKRIDYPKQELRDMLKEMFDLLRSPTKEATVIIYEFQYIYQPKFRDQVFKFLKMMESHSKIHIKNPILVKQRSIIPELLKIVS